MNHGTKRSRNARRLSGSARLSRRDFCQTALAGAAALTAVPPRVLGGREHVPPSGRINLAVIGTGCHGLRHITSLLANQPDVHVVAVCDVNQEGSDYFDYAGGVAGREPARRMVESHYAERKRSGTYKGCAGYPDRPPDTPPVPVAVLGAQRIGVESRSQRSNIAERTY